MENKCLNCESTENLEQLEDYYYQNNHWKKVYIFKCVECLEKDYNLHFGWLMGD